MNVLDLRSYLESWPYDADRNVRVARGVNGREIILVRRPMGIEQYEVDGRPDGRRMHGLDTVLDFHQTRWNAAGQSNAPVVFELTAEECAEMFEEAGAYYRRLILFFRLKDWRRAWRDATQILGLLEGVKQHARCAEDRARIDQWRPRITRIEAVARAMILLEKRQYREAFQIARDAMGFLGTVDDGANGSGKLAETLLESVRGLMVDGPTLYSHEESSFMRQDDYWTIRYDGRTALLKSSRGLHCVACLLRFPGREFHVSELLASLMEAPVQPQPIGVFQDGDAFVAARLSDAGPVLDAHAKAEYQCRLKDLRQDLAEAEQFNDPERAAKAVNEMKAITQHLASAIGLGGRDRKTSSEAERARSAVTKRIKKATQKISEAIPALGHHLTARIKTGYFCSYNPHPDRPVAWKF